MKNLTHLAVPKDTNTRFPFNTIQNETPTQDGTPVVRELYGDPLTNIWKIIQLAGIAFTGDEDSDDTQYQLVDALRKFHNELNDIEQTISLNAGVWSVPLNIDLLPNKYLFIGRAAADYVSATPYTFKGSTATAISASSPTGFKTNDEVLTVIDAAGVRMYSLTHLNGTAAGVFNTLGAPLSFNDTDIMYYLEDGKIYTDGPAIFDIEESIKTSAANADLVVSDAVVFAGKLITLVYDLSAQSYHVYTFALSDLAVPAECTYTGIGVVAGVDNSVYMFCDGKNVFFTNEFNGSSTDSDVVKTQYTPGTNEIALVSTIPLTNGTFTKTTNTVISNGKLYTFIEESLNSYDLATAAAANIFDNYSLTAGNLFFFNTSVYFSRNEVAAPWNL